MHRLCEADERLTSASSVTSSEAARHLTTEERNKNLRTVYLNSAGSGLPTSAASNGGTNKPTTRSIGVGCNVVNENVGEKGF